jgi:regulator of protease activity HflC (stomatin/prohibitin superfamily)
MKRVIVDTGKIGLVFKRGNYNRVITEGIHWLSFFEEVKEYDMSKPFYPSVELNILLNDKNLANYLTVVEVKDHEIVLQLENGNFKNVLVPGRYSYWNGATIFSFIKVDLSKIDIPENIDLNMLLRKEVISYVRVYIVESFEKGILYIDGRFEKVLEAGIYYFLKNATVISVTKADLRQLQMEISGQEILTKDKAAIRVNFFTQYKVVDIMKALNENKDFDKQLYILMQLALREFIGTFTLDELLEKKDSVSDYVLTCLKGKVESLGVEIKDCGIKDIILPGEVKEIMNQVLIAQKKAQANIITRREETASTRSLLNTAKLLEENEVLFKLKEMEYVEKIADKINSISLSGGNHLGDQLKDIFIPKNKG